MRTPRAACRYFGQSCAQSSVRTSYRMLVGDLRITGMPDPADVAAENRAPRSRVFLRLLRLLRPHWPMLALGLFLLVLATPCELFPAIVWRYVTDEVVLGYGTSQRLTWWFSLGGTLHGP